MTVYRDTVSGEEHQGWKFESADRTTDIAVWARTTVVREDDDVLTVYPGEGTPFNVYAGDLILRPTESADSLTLAVYPYDWEFAETPERTD